jgi:hypothetical protein
LPLVKLASKLTKILTFKASWCLGLKFINF